MRFTPRIFLLLVFLLAQIGVAETYDIEHYLSQVQKNSKDLILAEKDKDMAKVNKKQALSTALPKVAIQGEYKRNLTEYYMYADFGDFGASLGMPSGAGPAKFKVNRNNEYSANIALQQTLFSPSVGSAIKAANQYKKLTDYAYEAGEQAILTAAKKMFFQTLLLEKFWHVSQAAEDNSKENYDNMKLKFDSGVISEFELLQSQVRWKNAIPQTAETKRNLELMLNNLKNWAGISVVESLSLDGKFDDYPAMPEKMQMESILQVRPDFKALTWEQELRNTNVSAKKAAFLPSLTGTVAYAYSAQSDQFKLEQENGLYFAGVNLSWPIFTGGYRASEIQKAQIELDKTRVKIDQTKDNIYNEISNIYLRLEEAHQRIASAEATLTVAEKAFTIAEDMTLSGLATQLQLKDARVGFDQAKMNYYAAIFDYLSAYFDWERATGRLVHNS
jgi:outer membrane protein